MSWLQTRTGVPFDLNAPSPDDVRTYDIAYALAWVNRYTGHAGRYSVAEHCCHVSDYLLSRYATEGRHAVALAGLLHDAHEAYVGDLSWPVQQAIGPAARAAYKAVQAGVDAAILGNLGLTGLVDLADAAVRQADLRILLTERDAILGPPPSAWHCEDIGSLPVTIEQWEPERAQTEWLRRLAYLLPLVRGC